MNILVFSWLREYTLKDILSTFSEINVSYHLVHLDLSTLDKSDCPKLHDLIADSIQKKNYDAVFSVNYFPDIAKACHENSVIYISWSYDCPLDIRDIDQTVQLPTNRAFFFDKEQCNEYENNNNTVFYMPLAVNSKRLSNIAFNSAYSSEISFVGRVYHSTYPYLKKYLDNYYIGYLDGIIQAQESIYGCFLTKQALDENFMYELNKNFKKNNCPFTQGDQTISLQQMAISLVSEATFENRLLYLGLLSKNFDLKWYTTPDSESLPGINKFPAVNYSVEMPQVFKSSKINLHIGLHAITTGISLRQLDIMASGGFLLSSYQPDLFEYFTPEEDFDYFTCVEEALDKCKFYLSKDDLRQKFALSAKEKVSKYFDYKIILSDILNISFG